MVVFDRCGLYIESFTQLSDKITAINRVIDALETSALNIAAGGDSVQEYQLNDGQTIIKEVYRSSAQIANAINAFEAIKQRYVNRLNGRVIRGVDSKNFKHPYGGR